jgi:biotin transport system permease protein
MARIDGFGYLPGHSELHRLDPRVKLTAVAVFSVILAKSGFPGLSTMTALYVSLLLFEGIPLTYLPGGVGFLSLLSAVFLTRMFTTPGGPLFHLGPAMATADGAVDGLRICWRLWIIAALGGGLTLTARPAEIRAAVHWFLKPIPLLPAQRVSLMMGMMLRLIPMILGQARLIGEAQRARSIENRKNPVFRIKAFMMPFLRNVFLRADRMAIAMEARGFSENRTDPELNLHPWDRWAMAWIVAASALVVLADRWLPGGWRV